MNFIKFRCYYQDDVWVNPEHVATVTYNGNHECVEIRLSGDRLILALDFKDPAHVLHYLKTGYHYSLDGGEPRLVPNRLIHYPKGLNHD